MEQERIKQVVELPIERFKSIERLESISHRILDALDNIQGVPRNSEYLTAQEFMDELRISRNKFDKLRHENKLKVILRGRKLYVPVIEVKRYFDGEME